MIFEFPTFQYSNTHHSILEEVLWRLSIAPIT
jgi:hypothetical protein